MKTDPFIIERTYNAPVKTVWKAITNNHEMKKWYFDLPEFKAAVGFKFQFVAGKDDEQFVHHCEVTEVINEKKLTYSWSYEGYEGISYVTFELFAVGDKTRLQLTHAGLETFPQNNPAFARESFVAGWTHILGISLNDYLKKDPAAQ